MRNTRYMCYKISKVSASVGEFFMKEIRSKLLLMGKVGIKYLRREKRLSG